MKILPALSALAFMALASVTTTQARDVTSFNEGWEYTRGVMIPEEWKGKRIFIKLEV